MSKNVKISNPMKVITGVDTRWSYANVWEPKSINGGTPKYSVSLIIPKSDTKTIAKIENIDYISMAESMDIGSVINKKLIAASYIYQFLLDVDVSNVKCLTFANADVAELVARPNSKITKKQVKDLRLPKDMTLGGMIRDGEPMMIKGDTQVQAYDHVVVFCLDTAMRKLEDYFN